MPLSTEPPSSIIVVGGPRPKEPLPEDVDHPDRHPDFHLTRFYPNSTELRSAFGEGTEMLAGIDVPAGFNRLNFFVCVCIVRDLACKRVNMQPGDTPIPLLFRPDGLYLCPVEGRENVWMNTGRPGPELSRCIVIGLRPPLPEGGLLRDYTRLKPSAGDLLAISRDDCQELSKWFVSADGRTWKAGTPWPAPLEDEGPAVALSAKAIRHIMRVCRQHAEQLPAELVAEHALIFNPDGVCHGSLYPLSPQYLDMPRDRFIKVRVRSDDPEEMDALESQLHEVRVTPSGRVLLGPS